MLIRDVWKIIDYGVVNCNIYVTVPNGYTVGTTAKYFYRYSIAWQNEFYPFICHKSGLVKQIGLSGNVVCELNDVLINLFLYKVVKKGFI